tara:strand:+ start:19 stop:1035 length:1017 start_codon:yes stop_codon:yes gene_type:complete
MNRLIYFGFFIVIAVFINRIYIDLEYITVILSAFLFPLLFIFFLQRIDVFERENIKDILYVFIFGCVASFVLSLIYVPVRNFFVPENQCSELLICLFSVALPEEIIKIIPFVLVLKYRKFIDEPIDYLIYASASALGFAFIENIQYIYSYSDLGGIVATRSFLPLIMHMVTSSILAFGIFLYANSKRIKYIFYGLIIASFLHAAYNSLPIGFLVLIFMLIYYARLIQSLLNISPFYDESKENDIHSCSNFLLYILIFILILDFIYDIYHNGTSIIFENPLGYIFTLFIPYAIYKIISSRLSLKKANFIALGTRNSNFKFIIEMQDIIISYYKKHHNKS